MGRTMIRMYGIRHAFIIHGVANMGNSYVIYFRNLEEHKILWLHSWL
jgi:hypothetical protein